MKWTSVTSVLALLIAATASAAVQPFVIGPDAAQRPEVVLPFDPETKAGFDLEELNKLKPWSGRSPLLRLREAVEFFNEAVEKMTGAPLAVRNDTDLSRGVVLTTLEFAPPDVREDPAVIEALAQAGAEDYAANEALYIRNES